MRARFWIKLAAGVLSIVLLIMAGIWIVEYMINAFTAMFSDEVIEDAGGDYAIETPEPRPTMPPYMMEDSFYDDAGSVGDE